MSIGHRPAARTQAKQTFAAEAAIPSYDQFPAKTWLDEDTGLVHPEYSVLEHCQIVGTIAQRLIALYPVELQKRLFRQNIKVTQMNHDGKNL